MKTPKPVTKFISHYRRWSMSSNAHQQETSLYTAGNAKQNSKAGHDVKLAYIGSIVPDEPSFQTPAFSRAGNMCQQNLLLSLVHAGLPPSIIISFRPEQSFPGGSHLWVGKEKTSTSGGLSIDLLPFINITPLKQLMIGMGTLWSLLLWGWRNRKADHRVVYTFNISVPSGFFTLLGAWLTHSKVVAMVYDINVPGETVPFKLSWRIDYWLHKILLPRFDGLVVIADPIIKDFAPGIPFVRVEGGIDDDSLCDSSNTRRARTRDESSFVIVFAGGLKDANGILELLEAFSLTRSDQYHLRIAGMGPLESNVKEAAQNDSRIEYCGYLSFDEVLALYDTADVLINMRPTKTLNTKYFFPSKLMEYLASGVPVITTCTGYVEEEYAEFAFLLKDEASQGLADMIEHVASLEQNIRIDKGIRAKNYVCSHKTWNIQGQRVFNFMLEKVLNMTSKSE